MKNKIKSSLLISCIKIVIDASCAHASMPNEDKLLQ